ncbi:hypothetical protein CTI12_AA628830 [Artemisia annua]|uniref:Uncharacterized protein n=1 Tax=Artemisia annua TaxID=35608 RepID=A0A2U1K9T9_ARTAN|nr:hypothetical protein CTI12_AA628830 [Artemisia annua]
MTGDEDLYQILRRFFENGYTNVLVYPDCYSRELLDVVHYAVPSRRLFGDELHLQDQMRLQPLNQLQNSDKKSVQTVVYWDAVTCRIPASLHRQEIEHIRSKVLQIVGGTQIQIRAYFDIGTLPSFEVPGVIYIEATVMVAKSHNRSFLSGQSHVARER